MRTYTHIIDTKAIKLTLNAIPDYWVVRDLSERDYGIDLMIEIFNQSGLDDDSHEVYDGTGRVCYLQVKGTNSPLKLKKDQTIAFPIEKKALLYIEKFATPFILVRACVVSGSEKVYFVWLQRYIQEVLDIKSPDWRISKQKKFSIDIPIDNELPKNFEKIEGIAARIKYVEEFSEFYERYMLFKPAFQLIVDGTMTEPQYQSFIIELKRLTNLETLWKYNSCQVTKEDILNLIEFVKAVFNGRTNISSIFDFPDPLMHNLEMLEGDNFGRMIFEQTMAELQGQTVY